MRAQGFKFREQLEERYGKTEASNLMNRLSKFIPIHGEVDEYDLRNMREICSMYRRATRISLKHYRAWKNKQDTEKLIYIHDLEDGKDLKLGVCKTFKIYRSIYGDYMEMKRNYDKKNSMEMIFKGR